MKPAEENTAELRTLFQQASKDFNLRGIIGVTSFKQVNNSLMDIQKQRMKKLVSEKLTQFNKNGFIISLAYVSTQMASSTT